MLWWLLLNVLVSEKFSKNKVSREIAFDLISLFSCIYTRAYKKFNYHESMSFLQNFTITRHLRQEIDDKLSACVDELRPYDLPITGDIKIYQCHMIKREWH